MRGVPCWLSVVVLVLACQSAAPSPAPVRGSEVASSPVAPSALTAAPAPLPSASAARPSGVSDAEARALVDAWLAAQNTHDFSAYGALYAARFEGVKRVGERVSRHDRTGWMKDRERMFQPPRSGAAMHVELEGLSVETFAGAARARFTQSYSKGTFSDRGPKELWLVREGKQLRIAREELLSSVLRQATRGIAEGAGFLFVIEQGVVLSQSSGGADARGPLVLQRGSVHVVTSALDAARLKPELRTLRGRRLLLGGRPECNVRIGALSLVVRVHPHFGDVRRWDGEPEGGTPGPAATDEQVAAEVWKMGAPELVGQLLDVPNGCNASWARDAGLPIAQVEAPSANVEPALRAEAERQMRADVQRTSPAPPGMQVELDTHSLGGDQPLVVGRYARGQSCADEIYRSFVWRVRGSGSGARLELINDPERTPDFMLEMAIDLNGDGRWELLGNSGGRLLDSTEKYEQGPELSITELDCAC
jgi:hypothetical protein